MKPINIKLRLILLMSLVLVQPAFAFSGKRPNEAKAPTIPSISQATSAIKESNWQSLHGIFETLVRRFSDIHSDINDAQNYDIQKAHAGELNALSQTNQTRCSDDQLTNKDAALARINWVLGCLTKRDARFREEYAINGGRNSISSPEFFYNQTLIEDLTNQQTNFKNGRHIVYPTLGRIDRNDPLLPIQDRTLKMPDQSSCKIFENRQDVTVIGFCNPGCFAPEELVMFKQGYVPVGDGTYENTPFVIALNKSSEMNSLKFEARSVTRFIRNKEDAKSTLYQISTSGGYVLRVSEEHAILLRSGIMRKASDIKFGDQLLALNGQRTNGTTKVVPVTVTSVDQLPYHGSFVNLEVASTDPKENIIVANGLLVGTNLYQLEEYRNLLEKKLFESLIPDSEVME